MTKTERIQVWRARLARARAMRDDWIKDVVKPNVQAIWEIDKPEYWPDDDAWINVPLIFSSIRSTLPTLLFSDPEFRTTPRRPIPGPTGEDVSWERSQAGAMMLNQAWREAEGKKNARVAIQNSLFAMGVLKSGYAPHFADDESRGEFFYDEFGNVQMFRDGYVWTPGMPPPELAQGDYRRDENGEVIIGDDGYPELDPGKLVHEEWFCDTVDPCAMLFDPEGGNVFKTTHRWVAEEWVRPLSEVRADTRIPAAIRKRIQATESLTSGTTREVIYSTDTDPMGGDAVEDDAARVRGYDIFDFLENRYMVIAAEGSDGGNDEFLIDRKIPPGIEKHPYSFCRMNEKFNAWYPAPDVSAMAPIQQEYSEYRSIKKIHRDHARNRYAEAENAFWGDNQDEQREMLASGPDGAIIKARADLIKPIDKATRDAAFDRDGLEIRIDFDQAAVQGSEARGVATARSATQASLIQSNSEIASDDRRDNIVQDFLSEAGRKMYQAMQANMTVDRVVRVETPHEEVPFEFRTITPEELEGEYDIEIKIGSTRAKNSPNDMMMLLQLVREIQQSPGAFTIPGITSRLLSALNLDTSLTAAVVAKASEMQAQMAAGPAGAGAPAGGGMGQTIESLLNPAGAPAVDNEAGGGATGAPTNQYGFQ